MKSTFRIFLGLCSLLVATWLVAPTLVIVPMSFNEKKSLTFPPQGFSWQWYENFFTDPAWWTSLTNSLQIAGIVAVIATIAGTMAAIGLSRMKHSGAGFMRALLTAPMVVPGVVLAIGIYSTYLNLQLVGTMSGFILAHTMLAIPFVIIAVSANLEVFDIRLETAAASLGANRMTVLRTVTLPLIAPGILSGLLFAFATSFDEIIVALFIKSPYLTTLPVQIFASISRDSDPTVAAVGTMIFIFTTLLIVVGMVLGSKSRRS